MNWLYEVFDWTWHLSLLGGILWKIFIGLMACLQAICILYLILSSEDDEELTPLKAIVKTTIIWFLPEIIIFFVGLIGYLIHF